MRSIKNTNVPIKAAGILVFLSLAFYIGIYFVRSTDNPYETAQAIRMTVRESCSAEGIVIRDEELLRSVYNTVRITTEEGKRISAGQIVAEAFDTEEGLENAAAVAELESRIASLEAQQNRRSANKDAMGLDSEIWDACVLMREAALSRDCASLQDNSLILQTLSFTAFNESEDVERQLDDYRRELDRLRDRTDSRSASIIAPSSGLFSTAVDGFEGLKPEDVSSVSVADVRSLLNARGSGTSFALGKLVYGSRWYFAALLDAEDAGRLKIGRNAKLYLGRYYNKQLTVRVEWISNMDEGQQAVLFSCGTNMTDILGVRKQEAELIFSEKSGFRVPRSAIHVTKEGQTCVYVKTGLQAELKIVKVIYDYDEYYVVESEELRAGDAVIISGKELSDGRVIE